MDTSHETRIQALREQMLELHELNAQIQARADADGRDLTDDESDQVAENFAKFTGVEAEIERREGLKAQEQALTRSLGRKTEDRAPRASAYTTPSTSRRGRIEVVEEPGKGGFRNLGEFARSVFKGSGQGATLDPRLIANAPTSFGQEGTGADGGFAVPPDFRTAIMEQVLAEDSLIGRTDQQTTTTNSMTFPLDETTPWQSSGGVQAVWMDEGTQLTQSKPALNQTTVRANKLGALVPVTEELMEDATALDSYLRRKAPQKIDYKVAEAILTGDGVGKPLGVLNSGGLVTVAKESGQAADTLLWANISKMWNACYSPSRASSVWIINQDCEPQLDILSFDSGATNPQVPLYIPAGGASASPYATLKGRPVIPHQAAKTVGDLGDIMLIDFTQYLSLVKSGGVRTEVSMHLYFDYDMTAFRFILRVGGQPWWSSSIAAANGSGTYSSMVALAARA